MSRAVMSASEMQIARIASTGPNGTRNASLFGASLRRRIKEAHTPMYKINEDAAAMAATHKNVPVTASTHVSAA